MDILKQISKTVPAWLLLVLGIIGAFLGIFEGNLVIKWTAFVVTALAVAGQYLQYLQSEMYVRTFSSANWFDRGDGFFGLTIPGNLHAKGSNPHIAMYMKSKDDRYSEVVCDVETAGSGDVIIRASEAFDGQIRIK